MSNTKSIESLNITGDQLNINYSEDAQNKICQSCNDLNESRSALYAIHVHSESVKEDHYNKLTDNYLNFHKINNSSTEERNIIYEYIKERFQSSTSDTCNIPSFSTIIQDSLYNRLGSFGHINSESNNNSYEFNNIRNKSNNNVQKIEKFKNNWFQNHTYGRSKSKLG